MVAAGIELPAILQAGRWKSTAMVNRYGERLLAQAQRRRAARPDAGAGLNGQAARAKAIGRPCSRIGRVWRRTGRPVYQAGWENRRFPPARPAESGFRQNSYRPQ